MKMVVHTTFCCGRVYYRRRTKWRYIKDPQRSQWTNARRVCVRCGSDLDWDVRGHRARSACLRYYHRRAAKFHGQGLTVKGARYVRHPNYEPRQRPAVNRRRSLANYHRRAARFVAQGLTSRGQVRKYNRLGRPANPTEIQWLQFRAETSPLSASAPLR